MNRNPIDARKEVRLYSPKSTGIRDSARNLLLFRTSKIFFFFGIRVLIYYGLQLVNQEGEVSLLARNVTSTIVEGDTADVFGRTKWDEDILYVVINGGIA